jgi:hypothetical protein
MFKSPLVNRTITCPIDATLKVLDVQKYKNLHTFVDRRQIRIISRESQNNIS